MYRLRPHRLAALVFALLAASSFLASAVASEVVREHEAQLLRDRAEQIHSLLDSLGTGFEAEVSSVAAIAAVTEGDPGQFATAVDSVAPGAADDTSGGWAVLRRTEAGFVQEATVGAPTGLTPVALRGWSTELARAAEGRFVALGFLGEGMMRRFALAAGRPGIGGDLIVYSELSLVAAASTDDDASNILSDVAVEVFIGSEPDPSQLLLGLGKPDESAEERMVVDIGGIELLLEVSPTKALSGSLATNWPDLALVGGSVLALAIASVVELVQRRRDDALAMVADLESKNHQLDDALVEQRAAEAAREALEDQLRQSQRLEAIGHLAGGVAHDFNNVLAAILSYADLAGDGVTDTSTLADLEAIRGAARRGAGLTRQLLQFSRRESGDVQPIDLNERVSDVMGMLERTLGEDITLSTTLAAHPATVSADPVELDQIILNLVVNARDAVSPGGTIDISTRRVEVSDAGLSGHPGLAGGEYIRLAVRDDGHGMEPEVAQHAFEPFFTTKARGHGTGLGLATVYGIVQRQCGSIAISSAPGAGTTFEVLLPAGPVDGCCGEPLQDPSTEGSEGGSSRRVLLVEDEEALRLAMHRMLVGAGFDVLDAPDGASALAHLGHDHIDLLLTDVVMPGGLTGADVATGFRAQRAELPVVFVTGYSKDILDLSSFDGAAPTTVLSKPFSEADLLDVVGEALEARA